MAAPSASRLALASAPQSVKASGSEAYYKSNLDLVLKENKQLKQRLDQLEKENRGLKKAVYDLSVRHSACIEHLGKAVNPFDIENVITPESSAPDVNGAVHELELARPSKVGMQGVSTAKSSLKADGRRFYYQFDLKGHMGAIYAAQFSNTSNLLASGSFDQSVRVWDIQTQREVLCFQEHQLNVSDLCWSNDGAVLLSGGFDQCVKEWDVSAGKVVHSYSELHGFVQAVRFNPADNDVFLVGSTSKKVYIFDRRVKSTGATVMLLSSDAKVSALIVYRNGIACLSGDWNGAMKLWDLRTKACVDTVYNEELHKPITSIDMTHASDVHGDNGVHVAVNSYDNVLRVYDRFSVLEQPQMRIAGMRRVHAITGTRTKNWPIKCSMFQGHDCEYDYTVLAIIQRMRTVPETTEFQENSTCFLTRVVHRVIVMDQERRVQGQVEDPLIDVVLDWQSARKRWPQEIDGLRTNGAPLPRSTDSQFSQDAGVHDSLLLATGSADNSAYIFDVGGPSGTAELVQQLEGHRDRVSGAIFHPSEPVLATCGADCSIKVWKPRSQHFTDLM